MDRIRVSLYQVALILLSLFLGACSSPASFVVTGQASDAPIAVYGFGGRILNTSTDVVFTITNSGDKSGKIAAGEVTSTPFSFKGGAYPGAGGSCAEDLGGGDTCTVSLTFAPTQSGVFTGTFTLSYNDGSGDSGDQKATVNLLGTGYKASSLLITEGASYDFGEKSILSSTDQTITITNVGERPADLIAPAALAPPFSFKSGNYPGVGGTCADILAGGNSCTIVLHYSPTSGGTARGVMILSYNDGAQLQQVTYTMTGDAKIPAVLGISHSPSADYGTQPINGYYDLTLTVNNTGDYTATGLSGSTLTNPFSYKNGTFPGSGGTCGATLAGRAGCTVVITFNPLTINSFTRTFTLSFNDGVADQTVSRFLIGTGAAGWTWLAGSGSPNLVGDYGVMGTGALTNLPGSRSGAYSWKDLSGNFWLFGGYGYDSVGSLGNLNDLWKYDGTNWTWVGGSRYYGQPGVYGVQGVAAGANVPGGREQGLSWVDSSGNFWLLGGYGHDVGDNLGFLNDLWKFNGTQWKWVSGGSSRNPSGVYGVKGVAAGANVPGGRSASTGWIDASNNLWLFGGIGYDTASTGSGYLSDLWKFDGTNWTWISGTNSIGSTGTYGVKGTPASGNVPGGKSAAVSWVDGSGNMWMLGGQGYDTAGTLDYLNELWRFDGTNWTWTAGSKYAGQAGAYGTQTQASASNFPGARSASVVWKDSGSNIWIFGGSGYDSVGIRGDLNDVWKFDGTAWTWQAGSITSNSKGVYGVQNHSAFTNTPGARELSVGWIDSLDNLWIFGGFGVGSNTAGALNDFWKF
ncbi:choice-of-anchor D domain-containing protein [Bdellovibrionota bacterium FG-1]